MLSLDLCQACSEFFHLCCGARELPAVQLAHTIADEAVQPRGHVVLLQGWLRAAPEVLPRVLRALRRLPKSAWPLALRTMANQRCFVVTPHCCEGGCVLRLKLCHARNGIIAALGRGAQLAPCRGVHRFSLPQRCLQLGCTGQLRCVKLGSCQLVDHFDLIASCRCILCSIQWRRCFLAMHRLVGVGSGELRGQGPCRR